jgi:hypothetical protein
MNMDDWLRTFYTTASSKEGSPILSPLRTFKEKEEGLRIFFQLSRKLSKEQEPTSLAMPMERLVAYILYHSLGGKVLCESVFFRKERGYDTATESKSVDKVLYPERDL